MFPTTRQDRYPHCTSPTNGRGEALITRSIMTRYADRLTFGYVNAAQVKTGMWCEIATNRRGEALIT